LNRNEKLGMIMSPCSQRLANCHAVNSTALKRYAAPVPRSSGISSWSL